MTKGPKNHNKPTTSTSPELNFSSPNQYTRETINKLIHTPMPLGDMVGLIDLMVESNKSGNSSTDIDYSEDLKQRLDSFAELDGVTKETLLTFRDLRKATNARYGYDESGAGGPNLTSLNSAVKFAAIANDRNNSRFNHYIKNADKDTMQVKARGKRLSAGKADPFVPSKAIDGIRTWKDNPESSASKEKEAERMALTTNLVNTPISVENMRTLLDAVMINFEDAKDEKGVEYIKEVQARLDELGDTSYGEHVDLRLLSQPIRELPSDDESPDGDKPKYSAETVGSATYDFVDQFIDFAEMSPELKDTLDDVEKYVIPFDADTSTGQASGFEGRWISEDRGDGTIVWFTKEQYEYNEENEKAVMRVQTNRDLGSVAAFMVGIKRKFNNLKSNTYTSLWKKIQLRRKVTKDRLVKEQQKEVAKASHARIMEKRKKKLDELTKAQTNVDNRLKRIDKKIESREASVEATQRRWVERKAKKIGKKEVRKRINAMKREYSFFERRDLKNSLTSEQKINLGMLIFNRTVVELNINDSERDIDSAKSHRDNLRERHADVTNERIGIKAEKTLAKGELEQIKQDLAQLEGQPTTEEIQKKIELKTQEKLEKEDEIKQLDSLIQQAEQEMSFLESRIGDLPDITELEDEHGVRTIYAGRAKARLDKQEQAWNEEFKNSKKPTKSS